MPKWINNQPLATNKLVWVHNKQLELDEYSQRVYGGIHKLTQYDKNFISL